MILGIEGGSRSRARRNAPGLLCFIFEASKLVIQHALLLALQGAADVIAPRISPGRAITFLRVACGVCIVAVGNGVHVGGSVLDFGVPESALGGLWTFQWGLKWGPFQSFFFVKILLPVGATATFPNQAPVVAIESNI